MLQSVLRILGAMCGRPKSGSNSHKRTEYPTEHGRKLRRQLYASPHAVAVLYDGYQCNPLAMEIHPNITRTKAPSCAMSCSFASPLNKVAKADI